MSHFIAHSVRFNKTFTQVQFKGGDNNMVPRSNEWTGDIPIEIAFNDIQQGSIKLSGYNEKLCLFEHCCDLAISHSDLHLKLINTMQEYTTAKNYIVHDMFKVVKKVSPAGFLWVSSDWKNAKRYGKYQAKKVSRIASGFKAKKVNKEPKK